MLLLTLASKLLIYLGLAMSIGGLFIRFLTDEQAAFKRFVLSYMQLGVVVSLSALAINFFAQVGHFAEAGWQGVIDPLYIALMWDSSVGDSVLLRALALIMLVLSASFITRLWFVPILCAALLAGSFALTGHTTDHTIIVRSLLSVHVLIGLLWVGSLYPLWQSCNTLESARLKHLMQQFGNIAAVLVAILLCSGVVIAWQLVGSFSALFMSTYGQLLLLKVTAVTMMLGLAALHKWRLVPMLSDSQTANHLKRSILLEALIGLLVLTFTALLTTITGPEAMSNHLTH
ncbi:hypothetical protein EOL70_06480 [Leucothrix sargassi]|nr:hypothetical protein EOL70_06480 [Leucothrix sargassi]